MLTDEQLNYLVANADKFQNILQEGEKEKDPCVGKEVLNRLHSESETSSINDSMGLVEAQMRKGKKKAAQLQKASKKQHKPIV